MTVERPAGVTAVAVAFLLAGAYLLIVGLTMLARPGLVSMAAGAELLGGLELAGPYMFLLMAALGAVIALGLWRLHRWARWLAILVAMIGVVMLLPSVSSAMLDFRVGKLAWEGLGTIVRVMIVWYLFQEPVGEAFAARQPT
jgi:multidrug transporter EmrE-like cation transporter